MHAYVLRMVLRKVMINEIVESSKEAFKKEVI